MIEHIKHFPNGQQMMKSMIYCVFFISRRGDTKQRLQNLFKLKDLQRAGSKFTIKDVSKDNRRWIPPRVKCLHNECHIWTKEDQNRESHTLSINTSRQSENFVLTTLLNLIIGQLYQID